MKIENILYGSIIIVFGSFILYDGIFVPYWGYQINLGLFKFPIGIFLVYFGIKQFKKQNKEKNYIEYSICPKCEESYNYSDLKDGICPKCDIKTVDLKGYYKKESKDIKED